MTVPQIPTVPWENPDQSLLWTADFLSPYAASWYTYQYIEQVPKDTMGWMVAQGWQIIDIVFDNNVEPPEPYFTMTRDGLNNWAILQSLMNSYTIAKATARFANEIRYNEIVQDWTEMLASSQTHFGATALEQNQHVALYLGNLDTYMSKLDALVDANKNTLDAAIATSTSLLNTMQTEQDAFEPAFQAVIDLLDTDYTTHAALARGFLTDLGTTETARITETWAGALTVEKQKVMNNGFYSAAITTDHAARNTRELSEDLGQHNDKLAREKLANQHTLYGQLTANRGQTLQGKERLHTLALDVLKYREAQTVGSARALADLRSSIITQQMSISMARLQGLQTQHDGNIRLMQYQLDERNKLLIGLYEFVERREDIGPEFNDLVKISTGLGDASGGWVAP